MIFNTALYTMVASGVYTAFNSYDLGTAGMLLFPSLLFFLLATVLPKPLNT